MSKRIERHFIITATCDPYNAKTHYCGNYVLRRNGTTPVKWIVSGRHSPITLDEANDELDSIARDKAMQNNYSYEWLNKKAKFKELVHTMTYIEAESALDYYKGRGLYYFDKSHFIPEYVYGKDMSITDDAVTYWIEELPFILTKVKEELEAGRFTLTDGKRDYWHETVDVSQTDDDEWKVATDHGVVFYNTVLKTAEIYLNEE